MAAAKEEERHQLERFGYNPAARGFHEKPVEVVGYVPQPWYASLLHKGGLQVSCHSVYVFCMYIVYVYCDTSM